MLNPWKKWKLHRQQQRDRLKEKLRQCYTRDMVAILRHRGFQVLYFPRALQPKGATAWLSTYDRRAVMYIDSTMEDPRRRFALAHLLGHVELKHPPQAPDTNDSYQLTVSNRDDWDANRWAGRFLVPTELLHDVCYQNFTQVEDLAEIFGVSEVLIYERLREEGIVRF